MFGQRKKTIMNVPHIPSQVIQAYKLVMRFEVSIQHVYMQTKADPKQEWMPCQYKLDQKIVEGIVNDQTLEWKIPVSEEEMEKQMRDQELEGRFEEMIEK